MDGLSLLSKFLREKESRGKDWYSNIERKKALLYLIVCVPVIEENTQRKF